MVDLLIRRRARQFFAPFLLALACAYFLGHGVLGDGGVTALMDGRAEVARLEARLQELRARRNALEATAERLHPDRPDLDLLSEIIRKRYGYVRKGEVIVRLDDDHG